MTARTFHKDFWRTILKSKMRFLSILAIIALGVGFFAGIKATEPDMILSADAYYQQTNLSDFQIISPLGLREQDIDLLRELEAIDKIQPGYQTDLYLSTPSGNRYTVRLMSIDPAAWQSEDELNQPQVTDGRGLEHSGEIIIESSSNVPVEIMVGSAVRFETPAGENLADSLKQSEYLVVGRAKSPLYINFERGQTAIGDGSIDFFGYILEEDFNQERYATVSVRTRDSDQLQAYSEAYQSHLEPIKDILAEQGRLALRDETEQYRG